MTMQEICKHRVQLGNVTDAWLGSTHASSSTECSQYFRFLPTSHGQNDPKLCLAAQHSRIGLGHFFERIGFNHGAHSGLLGEV
jgi:hypothetical protein